MFNISMFVCLFVLFIVIEIKEMHSGLTQKMRKWEMKEMIDIDRFIDRNRGA